MSAHTAGHAISQGSKDVTALESYFRLFTDTSRIAGWDDYIFFIYHNALFLYINLGFRVCIIKLGDYGLD